eukprot:TRINITY_DN592_c0_g1_i1.p1 TRINITY_DN592_c0_g1~~TRINITY_DN592_c0_g1_i1.p1  ORF type:complete len:189 (+),score=50.05 TRINITY_DN592_c0_g1_i1:51-569(+)
MSDIGYTATITLNDNSIVKGEIVNVDEESGIMILRQKAKFDHTKRSYTFVNLDSINNVNKENKTEEFSTSDIPPITSDLIGDVMQNEGEILRNQQIKELKIGLNVSLEAQQIFNALDKTYPCSWDNTDIVVYQICKISEPYTIDDISGERKQAIERMKKVLQAERKKLKLKN